MSTQFLVSSDCTRHRAGWCHSLLLLSIPGPPLLISTPSATCLNKQSLNVSRTSALKLGGQASVFLILVGSHKRFRSCFVALVLVHVFSRSCVEVPSSLSYIHTSLFLWTQAAAKPVESVRLPAVSSFPRATLAS